MIHTIEIDLNDESYEKIRKSFSQKFGDNPKDLTLRALGLYILFTTRSSEGWHLFFEKDSGDAVIRQEVTGIPSSLD